MEKQSLPSIDLSTFEAYVARYALNLNDFLEPLPGNEGETGVRSIPPLQMQGRPMI